MPPGCQQEIAFLKDESASKPSASSETSDNGKSVQSKPEVFVFENCEVRETLDALAKKAGTNLDLPENVWGTITARFVDLPPSKIIKLILESKVCSGDPVYDPDRGVEIVVE